MFLWGALAERLGEVRLERLGGHCAVWPDRSAAESFKDRTGEQPASSFHAFSYLFIGLVTVGCGVGVEERCVPTTLSRRTYKRWRRRRKWGVWMDGATTIDEEHNLIEFPRLSEIVCVRSCCNG